MADKRIQIKDKSGNRLFPAIDLALNQNLGILPIEKGGTNANSAAGARTNLGVYSTSEVDSLIASIDQFQYTVVTELPTASADTMFIIYLIEDTTAAAGSYVEWLTIDKGAEADPRYVWESIGTTAADLSDYSKNSHWHTFTGTQGNLSVSGSYDKTTAVTIGTGLGTANFTPDGDVALTQVADVELNTVNVNSITNVGTLPNLTLENTDAGSDIPVVSSLTNSLGISHTDPTFNSSNIHSILSAGSPATLKLNNVDVTSINELNTFTSNTPTSVTTEDLVFSAGTLPTKSAFTYATGALSSNVGLASDEESSTGALQYVESIESGAVTPTLRNMAFTAPVLSTATAQEITSVGTLPSISYQGSDLSAIKEVSVFSPNTPTSVTTKILSWDRGVAPSMTYDNVATGGEAYLTGVTTTSYTPAGNVNLSGSRTSSGSGDSSRRTLDVTGAFAGTNSINAVTGASSKYMHWSAGSRPSIAEDSVEVAAISSVGTITNGTPASLVTRDLTFAPGTLPTAAQFTYADGGFSTPAALDFNAAEGNQYVYNVGSIVIDPVVKYMSVTQPTLATASGYEIDGVGTLPSIKKAGVDVSTIKGVGTVTAGTAATLTTNMLTFAGGEAATMSDTIGVLTGINTAGSASLTGSVDVNNKYLRFDQGMLPTKGADTTVATTVKTQPSFTAAFTGEGVELTATVTNTATNVSSTGTFTPAGTISSAVDE